MTVNASRRVAIATLFALLALQGARAADDPLPPIDDLRRVLATVATTGRPLLLLFSTPGCPYCREVRDGYLRPRLAENEVLIHEVSILSPREFRDERGAPTSEAQFATRFGVRGVPHVALFDARLRPLGEPLVGIGAAGFYEHRIATAIAEARAKLKR